MAQKIFNSCADGKNKLLANEERVDFYKNLLPTVWIIQSKIPKTIDDYLTGTAFCIDPRGLLMTSAYNVDNVDEILSTYLLDGKEYSAKVLKKCDAWNVSILQLLDVDDRKFDYVRFADDGDTISCGEEIHTIGNPLNNFGSFSTGHVAYPFDGFSIEHLTTDSHEPRRDGLRPWDGPNPPYRTVGSILSFSTAHAEYNPKLPIVQLSQSFCKEGASGSPVFDNRGYIVGMLFAIDYHCNLAIPFVVLKYFQNNTGFEE